MSSAAELLRARRLANTRAELESERATRALLKAKGEPGPRGPKGDKPDHEWKGTQLRFEKPDGGWGEFIDLRGPKGSRGDRGPGGGGGGGGQGGASDFDPDTLPVATTELPTEIIVKQGGVWVRAPLSALIGWIDAVPQTGGVTAGGERIKVNGSTVFVNGE